MHRGRTLRCTLRFENQARAQGFAVVAGLDEVGRGALCGPVLACAVVLGRGFDASGVDDSKRLTRRQRERLAERIRAQAQATVAKRVVIRFTPTRTISWDHSKLQGKY